MSERRPPVDFERVGRAALASAVALLHAWLPGGQLRGREYECAGFHGGKGQSLRVNVRTGKWSEFNGGVGGRDLVALYAQIFNLSQPEAAREVARECGLSGEEASAPGAARARAPLPEPPPVEPEWLPESPVPPDAPPPPLRHFKLGDPSHVAELRDAEGRLLTLICRFDLGDGRKEVLPRSFGSAKKNGAWVRGWHWRGLDMPRPLYGLDELARHPRRPVLVVEGEKKRDAAALLIGDRVVCVSWLNGAKGIDAADWSPLVGRRVAIWPDNDAAGIAAAERIAGILRERGGAAYPLPVPEGVPEKWDLGDAAASGWTGERVLGHMRQAVSQADAAAEKERQDAAAPEILDAELPERFDVPAPEDYDSGAPWHSGAEIPDEPEARGDNVVELRPRQGKGRRARQARERDAEPEASGGGWPPEKLEALWGSAPVRPVGHAAGRFFLFDHAGQLRDMPVRDLTTRAHLVELFGERAWLLKHYWQRNRNGERDIRAAEAGEDLAFLCHRRGLYSPADNPERRPGIWADRNGRPLLHLGDVLRLADGSTVPAGCVHEGGVYPRAAAVARPAPAAGAEAGRELLAGLERLWCWRDGLATPRLLVGWMATGLLGAAAPWRPNVFVVGPAGTGKSKLTAVVRAGLALHAYTNDASKAGIEQSVSSRPGPIIIDEAAEADRGERAQMLVGMLRAMTQGDGAQGRRGTPGGGARAFSVLGAVMLAATVPPPMEAQDAHRLTLLELARPRPGAPDGTAGMDALAARAAALAPALWGRVLEGFDRWRDCLAVFRAALVQARCAPRQADQLGPQLAGWWLLCHDGVPSEEVAAGAVRDLGAHVVSAEVAAEDDAPQRALTHLLTSRIATDKAGERRQVGELLARAFSADSGGLEADVLRVAGLRVEEVRPGRGVFVATGRHVELEALFAHSSFRGGIWGAQLARLPGAVRLPVNRRIGAYSGRVVFLPEELLRLSGGSALAEPSTGDVQEVDEVAEAG